MPRFATALPLALALSALLAASAIALHGGSRSAPTARTSPSAIAPGPAWNAMVGCGAGNARDNSSRPYENGYDFVPLTADGSLGYHVAYSTRKGGNGQVNYNVTISVLELDGGEILVFGAGYGNFDCAYNGVWYDLANVDAILQGCLGRTPGSTVIRFVAPHWHGDHLNVEFIHGLESMGYSVIEIAYHEDDDSYVHSYYNWTSADLAKFTVILDGWCNQELHSHASPLGKIWFIPRGGHTEGAIDLVIDVRDNPADRFLVLGSVPGGHCPDPPAGVRQTVTAHGNVKLNDDAQVVPYGCQGNPANSLVVVGGLPRLGHDVVLGVDNPPGDVAAGAMPCLWSSLAPDPAVPCGSPLFLPGMSNPGEVLLSPEPGILQDPPAMGGPWAGPGNPWLFTVTVPNDGSLVGVSVFYQGALLDFAAGLGSRVVLTEGVELRIGP